MCDRIEDAIRVHLCASLQQAVGRFTPIEMHCAVEMRAVEPILVHIAEEVCRSYRRSLGLDRCRNVADRGLDQDELRGILTALYLRLALGENRRRNQ